MANSRPKIPRNVIVVAFVALASGFGQDLITPVLPAYLTAIGVGTAGIGLIDGLLQGATNLFRLVSGVLSDRWRNRKGMVFFGYALSSVARPLLALTASFGGVAALRLIDGVGKGSKDAPRDALVADSAVSGNRGTAFGFHRLVDTAGSVLGPLTATAVLLALLPSLATYRLIFFLAALPGAAALALIWFGVREPKTAAAPAPAAPRQPLPTVYWLFLIGSVVAMLTKINDSLFLVRAAQVGVPKAWVPAVFGGFTLIYALCSYPIGILSDRVGKLPFIVTGWFVLAVAELGFSLESSLAPALALFALYGLFFALTEGSGRALIADLVPAAARGTAYAIFYAATGVALIIGGWLLGHVWSAVSPALAFRLAAAGSLLGGLIFIIAFKKRRPAAPAPTSPAGP